ncbi:MAG TPA: WecB/TagA/CpsF family glycosyltransferase [Pirellulaceae bacterium]|nr:WecB/TagA/CpsF family glycosyltransferase [Pirellulaceae bacterium]
MIDRGRHNILGIMVNAVDYEAVVQRIVSAARSRDPLAVSALAVHGVMTGVLDREHRYRLNELDLIVPDGQPLRWALNRLHGAKLSDRVYGPTLMLKICERAAEEGLPIFLFGGSEQLLAALQAKLRKQFPNLTIAGHQASKFRQLTPEERDETVENIRNSGAAITLIGLGCPRQEVWAYEFRDTLSMPLLAVGAAFSFHAGFLPQAPRKMQDWGFEWLFRLVTEPRRLWQRYLVLNPLYGCMLCLQALGLRRFDPHDVVRPDREILYG